MQPPYSVRFLLIAIPLFGFLMCLASYFLGDLLHAGVGMEFSLVVGWITLSCWALAGVGAQTGFFVIPPIYMHYHTISEGRIDHSSQEPILYGIYLMMMFAIPFAFWVLLYWQLTLT